MRLALTALAAALIASPAASYMAQNGMIVTPAPNSAFEVSWSGRSGASSFWCAAGDYAMHGMNLPGDTRIYRYDAPRRRSGENVAFGFDPSRAERTGLLRLQGGDGVLAAHARQFCFSGKERHR